MMMHEERAKLLASQLWHSEACEPSQLIQPLTAALQDVEKETWEKAAIYWDTMAEGPCKDGNDFAWACRVASWCRAQAKEAQR